VMGAKRALASERWTQTAEAEFWTSFGRLAQAAREVGVLNGPVHVPVHASGFWPRLRKLVTYPAAIPGAMLVFVAVALMLGWVWAKTLAVTIDSERALLRGCLVPGSENLAVTDAFPNPPKPGFGVDEKTIMAGCAHILASLENKLGNAQLIGTV